MEKIYAPHAIESNCYQRWLAQGHFKPSSHGPAYCIMLPPPNVTGTLHMGHGFQQSLMDALIRYHRMLGDNTLWQIGTDHAGISTQMVVERQLLAQNITRHALGRDAFLAKVWDWKAQSGSTIIGQMKRLGTSADWSRERFTMDEPRSHAVREAFIHLHDEGLIYRGLRLVNWDPKLRTAISDLEVLNTEEQAKLYHIRYPLLDGQGEVIVATQRPETLFGDVAIAVNPKDERYKAWIGRYVKLPLTNRTIPIIADEYADPAFGSGCVKITPAHDFNDYAVSTRHDLPLLNILTPDAALNDQVPTTYQGLNRYIAREKVVEDLQKLGLIDKVVVHNTTIPRGDRSGEVLEPYLTWQWFVRTKPLAEPAIAAVETGQIRFVPDNWRNTYFQWMHNIEDWCISRQLWWGHRIPVWYDTHGKHYAGHNENDVRTRHHLSQDVILTQDEDVLDTWFSASLWPFSTLGWPEKTAELATFYPSQVLITGFDIIFFWVARMIMMGLKFMGKVPFHDVYITGLIRDHEGQKMSKSKGNVLDPIDLIDGIDLDSLLAKRTTGLMQPAMAKKIEAATRAQFPDGLAAFGTDALRFTFYSISSPTRELRFDIARLESSRNFCNKLWNAARFVFMHIENQDTGHKQKIDENHLNLADQWISAKLRATTQIVQQQLNHYRFDLAVQALYEFTWNDYCDWYVECAKTTLSLETDPNLLRVTRYTLVNVLETLLRLLHPFIPFISETIWQTIAPYSSTAYHTDASIINQPYPQDMPHAHDADIIANMQFIQQVITGLRTVRSEMNINPGKRIPLLIRGAQAADKNRMQQAQNLIIHLAKIDQISWINPSDPLPPAATALAGNVELFIPLAGLIDKDAETQRLNKEITKLQIEIKKCENKLQNPSFTDKAPAAVITQEKERLHDFTTAIEQLRAQLEKLLSL